MPSAEKLPLHYPVDVRHAFIRDEGVRRIARVAGWKEGSKLLHVGSGAGGAALFLAESLGCKVTAVDDDDAALESLRHLAKARALQANLEVKKVDLSALPFSEGEFEGILVDHRIPGQLEPVMKNLRSLLQQKGRLSVLYPAKVGRAPTASVVEVWEKRMGEKLRSPREILQALESLGFEPQSVETLSDPELDEFYKNVEALLPKVSDAARADAIKVEIALHRSQAGKASVSFALAVARRKEPGEKPPPSRSQG